MTITHHQARLARTLYRNLIRRSREIPSSACLQKYNLTLAGNPVEDAQSLREGLRSAFRIHPTHNNNSGEVQNRISAAIKGLRVLNSLDVNSLLPAKLKEDVPSQKWTPPSPAPKDSTVYYYGLEERLEQINWISVVTNSNASSTSTSTSAQQKQQQQRDTRIDSSDLPMLPVLLPMIPEKHEDHLPLIGHLYDVPVPGYHLDLPIYENRFIEMYEDLQKKKDPDNRHIVVPFPHPTLPGVFAEYGVLYQLRGLERMDEQALGRIKYKAHHSVLATPVRLDHVSNPSVFPSGDTYMRVKAQVVNAVDRSVDPRKCKENHDMIEMLRWWMCPLAEDLYGAIDWGVWGLVSVWIGHLQQELMELQANVIARVEKLMADDPHLELEDAVRDIQGRGYKERMIQIQVQLSTMVPRLLPLNNREQYLMLQQMIREEQERQRATEDDVPLVV